MPKRNDSINENLIVDMYCNLKCSLREIGRRFNVTVKPIKRILRKNGISIKPKRFDLSHRRFGKLLVLKFLGYQDSLSLWKCRCDCGNFHEVLSGNLLNNSTKTCGKCKFLEKWGTNTESHGFEGLPGFYWRQILTSAKLRKMTVDFSNKEIWELFQKQNGKCALSGLKIVFGNKSTNTTASLDRIDSKKGYVLDNVQWIYKDINFMKQDFNQKYFVNLCKKIGDKCKTQTV